jgi:hypothetical protein
MADTKDTAADKTADKAEKKEVLFKAGVYRNTEARVLNLVPAEGGDGETRHVIPGYTVELTDADTQNKHIHHLIKNNILVPGEDAEAKKQREIAEAEQAELDAAAAAKAAAAKK